MYCCKLFLKHFSTSFVSKPRSHQIIPLTSRQLLIIFTDYSYIIYDTLVQNAIYEGKLPELTKPLRIQIIDANHLLIVYPTFIFIFNIKSHHFQKHNFQLNHQFSQILYFEQNKSLAVLLQKPNPQPVELVHIFLQHPQKPQNLQPYLFKTSFNSYIIVNFNSPYLYVKQFNILDQELDIVELLSNEIGLDVSTVFGCFYNDHKLDIIGQKKQKMMLIEYDYTSNNIESQNQIIKDNILIISVAVCLNEYYGIIYIEPQTSQQYFCIISKQGFVVDQLKIKFPLSLQRAKMSLDGLSFYDFINSNQKWIEKVKSDTPTIIKFNQVKIIGKDKFYFHMLKLLHQSEGDALWRRVLRILK